MSLNPTRGIGVHRLIPRRQYVKDEPSIIPSQSTVVKAREKRFASSLRHASKKIVVVLALSLVYVSLNTDLDLLLLHGTNLKNFVLYSDLESFHIARARRHAQTTEFTGEPSHVRMCRSLLPRFDHALAIEAAEKKAEALGLTGLNLANIPELNMPEEKEMDYLIVEEDEHVCTNLGSPSDSLFQMFASTLLSIASSRFKLNVEYKHNCAQWRKEDGEYGPETIQEKLPADMLQVASVNKVPMEVIAMKNICSSCILDIETNNGTVSRRNCALFTRPTIYNPLLLSGKKHVGKPRISRGKYSIGGGADVSTIESAAETSSSNEANLRGAEDMQQGALAAEFSATTAALPVEESIEIADLEVSRRLQQSASNSNLPTGIVAILPVIKENLKKISMSWKDLQISNFGEETTNRLEHRPGTMVGTSFSDNSNQEENRAYSSVTDDHAVVYLSCKKENCADGNDFASALAMPYYVYAREIPRSVSTITVIATSECVAHVDGCDTHGEALAGFFTKFYPRADVKYIEESSSYKSFMRMLNADYLVCPPGTGCMISALSSDGKSSLVANPNLVFYLHLLSPEIISNLRFLPMTQVPVMNVADLDYVVFLNKIPPGKIGQCRHLRGRLGHWVQSDWSTVASYQYPTPIRHYVGEADIKFQPTTEMPFRLPTTFSWDELIFPTCEMQLLDIEGLCYAMADIDMDRIFIIGDSFGLNQAQSLWKLLGNEDNPNVLGVRDPNWDKVIDCPNVDRSITISYARNDQLIETDTPVDLENDVRNCYAFCYPWTERYLNFEGATLLMVNTGAHYQSHQQFQYALREFIKKVDELKRIWDVMLFRTSTPGHKDCELRPTTPFENYEEYAPTVTNEYSWDKFIGFNDYAVKFFDDRQREDDRGYDPSADSQTSNEEVTEDLVAPKRMKMEVLDIYPMTILRRDGHVSGEECIDCQSAALRDCMHYFLPGPPDWWNHLMYSHILDLGRRE